MRRGTRGLVTWVDCTPARGLILYSGRGFLWLLLRACGRVASHPGLEAGDFSAWIDLMPSHAVV